MGSALMFKRKAGIQRSIAGAAALCGVFFLSCVGDKDVDEPLRVREALEIPLNFEMNVSDLLSDAVFEAVKGSIVNAIPNKPLASEDEELNELTSKIVNDPDILDYIIGGEDGNIQEGGIYDYVLKFIDENPTAKKYIEDYGYENRIEEMARNIADEVEKFKEDKDVKFNDPISFTQEVSAIDMTLIEGPRVDYEIVDLSNKIPFSFTVYALFFNKDMEKDIENMKDDFFLEFIKGRGYARYPYRDKVINLFDNRDDDQTGLWFDFPNDPKIPPKSDGMKKLLNDWLTEKGALVSRWVIMYNDEPDKVLSVLKDGEECLLGVKLRVKSEFTIGLDSLFN